jgi:hypothetical protein
MARRGRKPQSDAMKVLKGTFQPGRRRQRTVTDLSGTIVAPKWLKGQALRVWHEKVAVYEQRGQAIRGCEGALAQYCALEADLIDRRKRRTEIPVALISAHRVYANEFYDTPASQQGPAKKDGSGRFSGNGRPPAAQSA